VLEGAKWEEREAYSLSPTEKKRKRTKRPEKPKVKCQGSILSRSNSASTTFYSEKGQEREKLLEKSYRVSPVPG